MSILTLTCDNYPYSTISISCSVVYGTGYYPKRLNQYKLALADGSDIVYDSGPTKISLILVLKNVSYSDGLALETFIVNTLIFSLWTFSIAGITGLNLGQGEGVGVVAARFPEKTLEGVFSLTAPKKFDVNLPITYLRS